MKKLILLLIICFGTSSSLFSQTYKMEKVFHDALSETYLSHWSPLDSLAATDTDNKFSLWGHQRYDESWIIAYEVEYFKGSAKQMHDFLRGIIEFTQKYNREDEIVTYISGVQVKTVKKYLVKSTVVYDKERKVICYFTENGWNDIFDKFIKYCRKNNIVYQ